MAHPVRYCSLSMLLLLAFAGCVSTSDRFEKATALEARGRWAEAARYYVEVLEAEPSWENARERLRTAGTEALAAYRAGAQAKASAGRYEDALQELDRADALLRDAARVDAVLTPPGDLDAYRAELEREALLALLREGEAAERSGHWGEALDAYDRAGRYAQTDAARTDLTDARARVHVRWAEALAEQGAFRAAFDQADLALGVVGPSHPLAGAAAALQEEALAAGSYVVAFLPVQPDPGLDAAPDFFVPDLDDVLTLDHWATPVPFVLPADPVRIRRELRRFRDDPPTLGRRDLAAIGRVVDADLVVHPRLVAFEAEEDDIKRRTRETRLKARGSTVSGSGRRGIDTTYVEERYRLTLEATVGYRIVDASTRRVVHEGEASASVRDRLVRGVFGGDWEALDLSRSERALFEDADRLRDELADELIDALAVEVADEVYDRLLRAIP